MHVLAVIARFLDTGSNREMTVVVRIDTIAYRTY
jgi:hypothetical protein